MTAGAAQSIADVSVSLPSLEQVIAVMTLQAGFNAAVVVVGATLLGAAAGTVGTFALLRKRVLMGDALAHSALPGLAFAFILGALSGIGGRHIWLLLAGATLSGILGVVCVQLLVRYSRLHEDTAIGAVLSSFFGMGVVLMSVIQSLGTGEEGGLHHFIFGQTAAMNRGDAVLTLVVAVLAILSSGAFLKEFRLVSFDQDFAAANGWPVSGIDLFMMSLVVIVTVVGLQTVGLLLIIAFLVVPAAGARFWVSRVHTMVCVSALIGGMSGYLGSCASALLPRLPAGAVIVLVSGAVFLFSFLFAPARGVFAVLIKQLGLGLRVAEDHLLREIYELRERYGENLSSPSGFLDPEEIRLFREFSRLYRGFILNRLVRKKLIECKTKEGKVLIRLLEKGAKESLLKVRNHRLWEEYLVTRTDMPASHVDYSADLVEHFLSPEIIRKLEQSLSERGLSVDAFKPPESVHPVGKGA